ncbi:MAG TPA: thioredoxin domain-containing protein [Terriglobia bacterium]|nr:thioredoxin domain-containing protein [Terriglobia bacterium]
MAKHFPLWLIVVVAALFVRDAAASSFIPDERGVGSKQAPIVIEIFSDFQCQGCAEFYLQTLTRVIEDYSNNGKVYLIHREYPLAIPSHRYSRDAARWALACAAVGQYERAAAALFRDESTWSETGNIEATIASAVTPSQLATVKQALKDNGGEIEAALEHDISLGRSFPVHGTPSYRIVVRGKEVFADHDEPQKPEHNLLRSYPDLKRFLDEQLAK